MNISVVGVRGSCLVRSGKVAGALRGLPFEPGAECGLVGEAQFGGDFFDGLVAAVQQLDGLVQPVAVNPFGGGMARGLFYTDGESFRSDVQLGGIPVE